MWLYGHLVAGVLWNPVPELIGRKKSVILDILMFLFGFSLYAMAENFTTLAVGRFLLGFPLVNTVNALTKKYYTFPDSCPSLPSPRRSTSASWFTPTSEAPQPPSTPSPTPRATPSPSSWAPRRPTGAWSVPSWPWCPSRAFWRSGFSQSPPSGS